MIFKKLKICFEINDYQIIQSIKGYINNSIDSPSISFIYSDSSITTIETIIEYDENTDVSVEVITKTINELIEEVMIISYEDY